MSIDPDLSRLRAAAERLGAPAAPPGPLGRLVAVGDGAALLAGLLVEVDQTLLGRRLAFVTGTGGSLTCDTWGRRLLAVAPAEVAPPLADLDAGARATLRQALVAALDGGDTLWVRSLPLPGDRDPGDIGLAAEALAAEWDCDLASARDAPLPAGRASPLAALAGACGSALAWLRLDGAETAGEGGSGAAAERLRAFAAADLPGLRDGDPAPGPHCLLLGRQDGRLLVAATDGPQALLMLVAPAALGSIIAAWRAALGPGSGV